MWLVRWQLVIISCKKKMEGKGIWSGKKWSGIISRVMFNKWGNRTD